MEEKNTQNSKNEQIINNNNEINNNPNKKSNTFNIIIGIASLLIAILGATFAYFSATAKSKENDVSVQSAYVSISYDGGTEIKATHLIPATETVAMKAYKKTIDPLEEGSEIISEDQEKNNSDRRCVDSKGREVCYVYQFSINSEGVADGKTDINGAIKINTNQFENLSYFVYRVDLLKNGNEYVLDKFGNKMITESGYHPLNNNFKEKENPEEYPDNIAYREYSFAKFEIPFEKAIENATNESDTRKVYPLACLFGYSNTYDTAEADDISRCDTYAINNNEKTTFQVVIWLEETNNEQDEQKKLFEGTVNIEIPGSEIENDYTSGKITGQMDGD